MRIKIFLIFLVFLFADCSESKSEKVIDEKYALERIKQGMSYSEVIDLLGQPMDSVSYRNYKEEKITILSYKTNNWFDYRLKITLDSTLVVFEVSLD
jgi:hypothetical protein